jgi:hypothetical protein
MNRYNPVHEDAMVADENGTHVRYEDHAAALTAERANTDTANAAAVTAYAKVRELEALLDTAKSALAAERLKFAALLDGAKAAVLAERAKFAAFADEKGEPRSHCINCGTWWDRKERCPLCMGTHAEMVATKQAAEAAELQRLRETENAAAERHIEDANLGTPEQASASFAAWVKVRDERMAFEKKIGGGT